MMIILSLLMLFGLLDGRAGSGVEKMTSTQRQFSPFRIF